MQNPDYSATAKRIIHELQRMIFGQLDDAAGDDAQDQRARERLVEDILRKAFPPPRP
jgi:hypothetical protein